MAPYGPGSRSVKPGMEFGDRSGRVRHDALKELTAAYALDAVDPLETQAIERHLLGCRQCRREVAELREVAAQLCGIGSPTPSRVWDRITAEVSSRPRRRRQTVSVRWFVAVVAAAAVAIATLGVQIGRVDKHADRVAIAVPRPGDGVAVGRRQRRCPGGDPQVPGWVPFRLGRGDGRRHLDARPEQPAASVRSAQLSAVGPGRAGDGVAGRAADPAAYQQFSTPAHTVALVITNEAASGAITTTRPAIVSARMPNR